MTKEIKITIEDKKMEFHSIGLTKIEIVGYLRIYEKRLFIDILQSMDSEPETKNENI